MKIYIAGPWVDRKAVNEFSAILEKAGFEITHAWWNYEESKNNSSREACDDLEGVRRADAVVVWNTALSEGKATEQGLAIAWNKPIVCLTPDGFPVKTNIFHVLDNYVHVSTQEDVRSEERRVGKSVG